MAKPKSHSADCLFHLDNRLRANGIFGASYQLFIITRTGIACRYKKKPKENPQTLFLMLVSPSPSQPQPGPPSHSPGDVACMQNRTGSGTGTVLKVKGSKATHWIPTTVPESLNLSVLICKMGVIILARQGYCKD